MSLELLKPITDSFLNNLKENYLQGSLFNKIDFHTISSGLPDIKLSKVCIIGVEEDRNSFFESRNHDLKSIREE